ncbi:MAG: hypothetical protein ACRCUT_00430 [Spirochaetota bacterium]
MSDQPVEYVETAEMKEERIREGKSRSSIAQVQRKMRIYSINSLGWWNFDFTESEFVNISGTADAGGYCYAYVIGLDKMGCDKYLFNDRQFRLRFLKNTSAVVLIISDNGLIGFSEIFTIGSKSGEIRIPEIELRRVDDDVLNDRGKLLKLMGITR